MTGALAIYASHADAYEAADSELLGRAADLAAVALESMRHVEELQRRSHAAEKLEEIGRVLLLASHGVTVSSGIAAFKAGQTVGVDELIQAADRSMYENKAAKR